ncbi:hypothetical protein [Parabacteroides sp.]
MPILAFADGGLGVGERESPSTDEDAGALRLSLDGGGYRTITFSVCSRSPSEA